MKKLLMLFALFAAPVSAQTIPADFHGWFTQHVAGQPANQRTLDALNLPCVGGAVTPPNAIGGKSKIWDPQTRLWTRVIEGDPIVGGSWVWVVTDQGPPPLVTAADLANCGTDITAPPNGGATMRIDYALVQKIVRDELAHALNEDSPGYRQQERMFADETKRLDALAAQVKAHDEKTSAIVAFFGNRYTQLVLAAAGAWLTTNQVMK